MASTVDEQAKKEFEEWGKDYDGTGAAIEHPDNDTGTYAPITPDVTVLNVARSPECNELFAALSKAQKEITGARRESRNPFYNSNYADLASVWDACREPLNENGLSVMQMPFTNAKSEACLETILGHESGQWISSIMMVDAPQIEKDGKVKRTKIQALGTMITYMRRYMLAAAVGVAQVDEDGQSDATLTESQIHEMQELAGEVGMTHNEMLKICKKVYPYATGLAKLRCTDMAGLKAAMRKAAEGKK